MRVEVNASQGSWARTFQSIMDRLPPAKDHLTLALLNSYGTQSVSQLKLQAYAKNLLNSLQQQVNVLATTVLEEASMPSEEKAHDVAKLTAALFKHSMCMMLSASAGGSGKVEALKVLLGRNRFWVAGFGVCADVAFFLLLGNESQRPVLQNAASPWSHFPLEMYHLARHCGKSCATSTGAAADCPHEVLDRFKHIQTVLAVEHVWQRDVALDLLEMHADTAASSDSSFATALGIIFPLKVFFLCVAEICSQWVQRALALLVKGAKATPGMKRAVLVEEFTMECLDAFLQTSLHVLLGVKHGSLAVMCAVAIYCGGKAATHEDLKHLNLFPPELIHMRTVVEAVRSEAPFGCCTADVAELRQTCTEVYNQEIITCHNNRIRRWIDKQHQDRHGYDQEETGRHCSVASQSADLGRVLETCSTGPTLRPPMRA